MSEKEINNTENTEGGTVGEGEHDSDEDEAPISHHDLSNKINKCYLLGFVFTLCLAFL